LNPDILTDLNRKVEGNVFGPAGQKMQAEVWKEVLAALTERVPGVMQIVGGVA
jgi:hypothetical protein